MQSRIQFSTSIQPSTVQKIGTVKSAMETTRCLSKCYIKNNFTVVHIGGKSKIFNTSKFHSKLKPKLRKVLKFEHISQICFLGKTFFLTCHYTHTHTHTYIYIYIYLVIAENQPTMHLPIEFLRKVKIKIYKTLYIMSNIVPDYFKELGEKNFGFMKI